MPEQRIRSADVAPGEKREFRLEYSIVDGVHFFTSPDVPGLCAAHKDFSRAAEATGVQLAALLPRLLRREDTAR